MSHVEKKRFARSWMRLDVDFGRLSVPSHAPGSSFWGSGASLENLRALPKRRGDVRDAPETLPSRSRNTVGRLQAVRKASGTDFESISDAPELFPVPILARLS